jgi:GNAT superfamily N-acetyltransferase
MSCPTSWQEIESIENDEKVLELYNLVIPLRDRVLEDGLLNEKTGYRAFVKHLDGQLLALVILKHLPRSKTLHIDVFAIHPNFRNRGFSFPCLNELKYIGLPSFEKVSIEAYPWNVNYFQKYGLIQANEPIQYKPIWTTEDVVFLSSGDVSSNAVQDAIDEWQEYQRSWGPIGYCY